MQEHGLKRLTVYGSRWYHFRLINIVLESDRRNCINPDFFGVKVKVDGQKFIDYEL